MKKKARQLKDIKLHEISLVDKAANNKQFLFFKQTDAKQKVTPSKKLKKKVNLVIDSDGTIGGTKISVNKKALENLRDFSFYFWGDSDMTRAISCSYTKSVRTDDGFSQSETFHLSKSGDILMNTKIEKLLKKYFGDEVEVDFEKASDDTIVIKALGTVLEYKKDFPDDLNEAVGVICKQAGFCDTLITKIKEKGEQTDEEDNKDDIEKKGAQFSKDNLKKIKEALAALSSLFDEKTKKSDTSEIEKKLAEITKALEVVEKKATDGKDDKLATVLTDIVKRLTTVEKGTGVRKSTEDDDTEIDENKEPVEKKWPSLSGE